MQLPASFSGIGEFESNAIVPGRKRSGKLPNDIEEVLDSLIMALRQGQSF